MTRTLRVSRTSRTSRARRLLGLCALISVAGCFRLARQTPPLEGYVLGSGVRTSVATAPRDAAGLNVGLRRLDLAEYLASAAIVVRRESRVLTSPYHRWSEEPAAGIVRTLAASLRESPAIRAVDVAPWAVRTAHDYVIQMHISRLEGVAPVDSTATDGEVLLLASWEIIRPSDGALAARGVTDHRQNSWKVGDYSGLVARLDKGLAMLAVDVAACLVRLKEVPPVVEGSAPAPTLVCRAQ